MGAIDEESFSYLEIVINMTKMISKNTEIGENFEFPHFLWVLRDFCL